MSIKIRKKIKNPFWTRKSGIQKIIFRLFHLELDAVIWLYGTGSNCPGINEFCECLLMEGSIGDVNL